MTKRQYSIFYQLLNTHPNNLSDLCISLDITMPTLRNEIKKLNYFLKNFNVHIYIDGQTVFFNNHENAQNFFSTQESKIEMSLEEQAMLHLLARNTYMTLQEIADELYLSKSKMHQVLSDMMPRFGRNISISRTNGYKVEGAENDKRNCFMEIVSSYFIGTNIYFEYFDFNRRCFDLSQYLSDEQLNKIYKLYQFIKLQNTTEISDEKYKAIFIYMLSVALIKPKGLIPKEREQKILAVFDMTNLTFDDDFKSQVSEYVSAIVSEADKEQTITEFQENIEYFKELFKYVDIKLSTVFSTDFQLLEQIATYVTELHKHELGLKPTDELQELQRKYPLAYEAAVLVSKKILRDKHIELSEMNRLYFTIYFQVSMMQQEHTSLRVAVITSYEKVSGELIKHELREQFSKALDCEVFSYHEFITSRRMESFELILTMVPLKINGFKIIPITPVLKDYQVSEIKHFLKYYQSKRVTEKLLQEMRIEQKIRVQTKEEVIEFICRAFHEKGYVTERYLETTIDREKISSTALNGIAVPHGDANEVLKDALCFIELEHPIIWGEYEVDFVFFMMITKTTMQKYKQVFNNMYRTIGNTKFYIELSKITAEYSGDSLQTMIQNLFLNK